MADVTRLTITIEKGKLGTAMDYLLKKKKATIFTTIALQRYLATPEGAMQYKDFTGHDYDSVEAISPVQAKAAKTGETPSGTQKVNPLARSLVK